MTSDDFDTLVCALRGIHDSLRTIADAQAERITLQKESMADMRKYHAAMLYAQTTRSAT